MRSWFLKRPGAGPLEPAPGVRLRLLLRGYQEPPLQPPLPALSAVSVQVRVTLLVAASFSMVNVSPDFDVAVTDQPSAEPDAAVTRSRPEPVATAVVAQVV